MKASREDALAAGREPRRALHEDLRLAAAGPGDHGDSGIIALATAFRWDSFRFTTSTPWTLREWDFRHTWRRAPRSGVRAPRRPSPASRRYPWLRGGQASRAVDQDLAERAGEFEGQRSASAALAREPAFPIPPFHDGLAELRARIGLRGHQNSTGARRRGLEHEGFEASRGREIVAQRWRPCRRGSATRRRCGQSCDRRES